MVEDTHGDERPEENDLREDHGPVRCTDGSVGRGDIGERERETGDGDGRHGRCGHRRKWAQPGGVIVGIGTHHVHRRAHEPAHPYADGRLMNGADQQEPGTVVRAPHRMTGQHSGDTQGCGSGHEECPAQARRRLPPKSKRGGQDGERRADPDEAADAYGRAEQGSSWPAAVGVC